MDFHSSMRLLISFLRGTASTLLFAAFGIGALMISPIVALLPRPEWGQRVIRFTWRPLVFIFVALGLFRIERNNLHPVRGMVIAANHPSFIDVVLLTVLMPNLLAVAKHALKHNPFMSVLVRKTTLPDDARLIEVAGEYLAKGWNVLIFPEGTRSPIGGLHPFRRGAVQLALRTHSPLAAIGIAQSERVLGKGQRPWQLASRRVTYSFRMDSPQRMMVTEGETLPSAARRLTTELESRIRRLMVPTSESDDCQLNNAAVVIPVFNPEPELVSLCEELVSSFGQVVVVDDGSVENCERFSSLPPKVTLLRHSNNLGKGRALKTAIEHLSDSVSTVVFADGDGQHRVGDIVAVARRSQREDVVVFGVRDFGDQDIPFRSWWGNRWTAWEVRLFFGFTLADTQTGLRAIPARLINAIVALKGERYEFESRLFKFLHRHDEPILEVPIATIYREGNQHSHFRPLVDTLRTQFALFVS